MKRAVLFSFLCFISFSLAADSSLTIFNNLVKDVEAQKISTAYDLPGISELELPEDLKDLLSFAKITKEGISLSDDFTFVQTSLHSEGKSLNIDAFVWPSDSGVNTSVVIPLPDGCKFSQITPASSKFNVFTLKKSVFIISTVEYTDSKNDIEVKRGINFAGHLAVAGPLSYLSWFIGDPLEQVMLSGLLKPDLSHSFLFACLPGRMSFMGGIVAEDLSLSLALEESPSEASPLCSVDAKMSLSWPGQEELQFVSEFDFYHDGALLYGGMEGIARNLFGIYGVHAGNWFLGATIDYESLAGYGDLIPFSEFVAGFDLEFAGKKVEMITKVGLPGEHDLGNLAFEGSFEGDFPFEKCVAFVGNVIEENPLVSDSVKDFQERVGGYLPNFSINDVHLFFSPRDIEINGTRYSKGLLVEGYARLFGSEAALLVDIEESGMKVVGYLEELKFGCLKITGPGYDREMDTPDDGLILDAVLRLDEQRCFLSGAVEIDIFGGITAETEVDVTASGLVFHLEEELFNLFEFGLIFSAQMNDSFVPFDFYVEGHMRQSALTALQNMLSKTSHKMALKKMHEFEQKKFDLTGTISGAYNGFWNMLAGMVGNTFNIKEFSFESSLDELVGKTHLPSVTVKGIVLGKEFELSDISFDLSSPIDSAKEIIEAVAHLFS